MDLSNLAPDIGKLLGLAPSTTVLLIFLLVKLSDVVTRVIPNDATGWQGTVRRIAAIIAIYVPSKVTSGVTVNDVAQAALQTPPVTQKVEAATGAPVAVSSQEKSL